MNPTPDRLNELLGKLPRYEGRPLSNDEHMQAARVLQALLIEFSIYPAEQKQIALTLARVNT